MNPGYNRLKSKAQKGLRNSPRLSVSLCLLLSVFGVYSCGGKDDTPAINTEYIDLKPDQCPSEKRIYPGRAGEFCPSGSLTDFSIRQLTDFGGRPRWSSDGQRIVFVEGEYAEAYETELATGKTTCITCEFEHEGIFRIYYMNNDDYLILGTQKFRHRTFNRFVSNAIYWMPADRSQPPKYLGEEHFEGVAVSRSSRKIAYFTSVLNNLRPSKLFVAEITGNGELVNKREVELPFEGFDRWRPFEAQDFFSEDRGLVFSHYADPVDTYSYEFGTGTLINQTKSTAHEEPEGLFPDDRFAAMESNRHSFRPEARSYEDSIDSDVYMLRLDGTGETAYRLTHAAGKLQWANNPNVRHDGCAIAYSTGIGPTTLDKATGTFGGVHILEFFQCAD